MEVYFLITKETILEVELIINNQLFNEGIISELQYQEVCNLIYEKINQSKEITGEEKNEIL